MRIDFHTHIFPERIAEKTISLLAQKAGIPPHSDGTADGLLSKMKEAEIDLSVALPVLTSPSQFESVNRFAASVNERFENSARRILSFAGIHPACEDIAGKMQQIKDAGFLGVKIHPDYQGAFINDPAYVEIVRCAAALDLIVVTHAGVDFGFRDQPVRCTPALALDLIEKVPHKKLVFAHLGGSELPKQVIEHLAGQDVYFDTSFVLKHTKKNDFLSILEKHGEDKLLFATDSPWSDAKEDLERFSSFGLKKETEEKILHRNAKKLLGI